MEMRILYKKYGLIIFMIFFAIIKQIAVSNIPIFAISNAVHDDRLMVNLTDSLLKGEWLGGYTNLTFVKGVFFPLFLAITNFLGISYISASTLLYSFSCIIFIFAIKDIFNTKAPLFVTYLVLLFNPLSFAMWTLQRVYRSGITLSQVLIIVGCLMAVYLRRKEAPKVLLPWAMGAGLALASLHHTREDGIWIMPFVVVATILTIVSIVLSYHTFKNNICIQKTICVCIPLIFLLGISALISFINYQHYGVYYSNELNGSNFASAMKNIYAVDTDDILDYCSVPKSTLDKLYIVSPTLAGIKKELDASYSLWDKNDNHPGDGNVEDGWFFWALRDGVSYAGYYESPHKANVFYEKVCSEIALAFSEGKLKKRAVMPSALMPPWRNNFAQKLPVTVGKAIFFVVSYDTVKTGPAVSITDGAEGIRLFENITNNRAILPANNPLKVKGWFFVYDDATNYSLSIVDVNNNFVVPVEKMPSKDVHNFFAKKNGYQYKNAKYCRFSIEINVPNINDAFFLMVVDSNGLELEKIPLNGTVQRNDDGKTAFHLDYVTGAGVADSYMLFAQRYIDRLNYITEIYRFFGVIIAALGLISYLLITVFVVKRRRTEDKYFWNIWLLLTGIFASFIVLISGVSYNEIASGAPINYMYLSSAYLLMISFCVIGICSVLEVFTQVSTVFSK